ncbi:hypothetical protein THRCLA_22932 [Thraustotheca clavata]|uniref:Crinkler effector protein N-terminal domain-containing protein n=1 Tax=Thraustotheca clavata TaxID=74557 RepID=A0A1V9YNA2_9STRA|nr:hypothetical protein THRCLA_22932 [Thraustotheca clavata]
MDKRLWCAVIDKEIHFYLPLDPAKYVVDDLKTKIKEKIPQSITCDAPALKLYLALQDGNWMTEPSNVNQVLANNRYLMNPSKMLSHYFNFERGGKYPKCVETNTVHVLIQCPPIALQFNDNASIISTSIQPQLEDVLWFGGRGSSSIFMQNIDLSDKKTLSRHELTNKVINHLDAYHILHIKSPPMTGKSSLAAWWPKKL